MKIKQNILERENSLHTVSSVQCLQAMILPVSFGMAPQPALELSRKKEAELTRSNKKVKDVRHADFMEEQGSGSGSLEASKAFTFRTPPLSFKDKLVGKIPGAYTQAFNFTESMDDDVESKDEVEPLRQGLTEVKFIKEFK